jgi:hypothetical protein
MTLCCGIDLHANNSVISVIDDHDSVFYEKRHANDLRQIRDVLVSRFSRNWSFPRTELVTRE